MAKWKVTGVLVVAAALAAGAAFAQGPRTVAGQWSGAYTCSQGLTGMTVELRPQGGARGGDAVDATITFYAHPDNPGVASGCYGAQGAIDRATGRLVLRPTRWIHRPNDGWSMTMLDGKIDAEGAYEGRVIFAANPNACRAFALRRNARPLKALPTQCITETPMS